MMTSYFLRRVHVLDESGSFSPPTDVHVKDGVIAAVDRKGQMSGDGEALSVDCSGLWLMPGVFDCHDHTAISSADPLELMNMPITLWALEAAGGLQATLEAGVTFVRDAAGADAGLRDAVTDELVSGPHLQVSIVALSETGGQVDGFLAGPGLEASVAYLLPDFPGRPPYLADGVDNVRSAVRAILRAGADWVKIVVSGAPWHEGQSFDRVEYTREEVAVAVLEAERKGKHVMADAKSPESILNAVEAGVRSIEHGVFLTEKVAARMAERSCWLVPTHTIYRDLIRRARNNELEPHMANGVRELEARSKDLVRIAKDAGVKIALGTDCFGRHLHGSNLQEISHLHDAGLTAEEALLTATIRGAELCGVDDHLGRIEPGYVFDAILLDTDPTNVSVFLEPQSVTGVFKGGFPVVEHPRAREAALTPSESLP